MRSEPWAKKKRRCNVFVMKYCSAWDIGYNVIAGCLAPGGTAPHGALTAPSLLGFPSYLAQLGWETYSATNGLAKGLGEPLRAEL